MLEDDARRFWVEGLGLHEVPKPAELAGQDVVVSGHVTFCPTVCTGVPASAVEWSVAIS